VQGPDSALQSTISKSSADPVAMCIEVLDGVESFIDQATAFQGVFFFEGGDSFCLQLGNALLVASKLSPLQCQLGCSQLSSTPAFASAISSLILEIYLAGPMARRK
jgi:hypothetical protein